MLLLNEKAVKYGQCDLKYSYLSIDIYTDIYPYEERNLKTKVFIAIVSKEENPKLVLALSTCLYFLYAHVFLY